jgi:MATE family multidrug resistance protein
VKRPSDETRAELASLFQLAWPIALSFVGSQLLVVVDTAIVGRLGQVELGAVGLGNSICLSVTVLGLGIVLGLDPIVSQALGAGEGERAKAAFWQGLWLGAGSSVPLAVVLLGAALALPFVGVDPAVAEQATPYMIWRILSVTPFLLAAGSRSFLQSHQMTRPYLVSVIVANVVNLPVGWLLVFGDAGLVPYGLPAIGLSGLGVVGAALATAVSSFVQAAIVIRAAGSLGVGEVENKGPDLAMLRTALRLGLPVGLTIFAEVSVFSVATTIAATLGPGPLAAHHVALTLAGTTFQVPLAIGLAACVRVGLAVGAGDSARARRAGLIALALSTAVMTTFAATFVLAPRFFAGALTDQVGVIDAAASLLFVAAVFQIFDGAQAVMAGSLRGAGDTKFSLFANVFGHYVVGLPISLVVGLQMGGGVRGIWWGLCAGLFAVGALLTWRFLKVSRGTIQRV